MILLLKIVNTIDLIFIFMYAVAMYCCLPCIKNFSTSFKCFIMYLIYIYAIAVFAYGIVKAVQLDDPKNVRYPPETIMYGASFLSLLGIIVYGLIAFHLFLKNKQQRYNK